MNDTAFRDALGHFATGVTIVTSSNKDGRVGLTANSFNSVSLDPPLVLWSLSKTSNCLAAISESGYFAVHILAYDQIELSKSFAKKSTQKFDGLACDEGIGGSPLISGCSAVFQCKVLTQYEGGDHIIFVGEVLEYERSDKAPLLFHKGKFHSGEVLQISESPQLDSIANQVGFTEDFFPYLMARAHFQLNEPIKDVVKSSGIDEDDYFIILLLSIGEGRTIQNIARCLEHTNHHPTNEKIAEMHERGLITIKNGKSGDRIYLSSDGAQITEKLLAASKEVEKKLRSHFVSNEVDSLKSILKKVILRTDPGIPNLWDVDDQG
ncbi:flavin reductase family protein [Zhongshania aquimaris]|uniref:Flavin reductase family protein n=1 Tax=Zhongshania aquimaris TaxID=2857107 RepID=A0ABS6VSS8_9GAMM|nr:flavin reductase family protein [Zhongshania aquimaris]MBW2941371.1 flavin reductase family protein [Zhongshania aquimaris]